MKKWLVIYSSRIPSVDIVCNLLGDVADRGGIEILEMQIINCKKEHIEWADGIIAIRPFEISAYGIIKAAKSSGREIIVYLDDDLLHLPHIYSSRLRKLFTLASYKRNCRYLKEVLGLCDVLWGSSDFLIMQYQKNVINGKCTCTDVAIDISKMKKPALKNSQINILYAGSSNHYAQLNKYIIPAVNLLSTKYKNIVLTCVGFRKEYIKPSNVEIICYPWIADYDDYYSFILGQSFDIGLSPVEQEDFYRCKYINKFIEYSLLGIVGIYTNDYPYKSVVRDRINGIMVENTVESWTSGIEYAIKHEVECKKMVESAQECCTQRFNRETLIESVQYKIPELLETDSLKEKNVLFRPHHVINHARKYANRFVAFYEKIRS